MFTVQEFALRFEDYDDEQLFEIYSNWNNYSEEAKEAFNIVVDNKGGVEKLLKRRAKNVTYSQESEKIWDAATELCMAGGDSHYAKTLITSDLLPQEEVNRIIDAACYVAEDKREDVKIKPRTLYGSIIGGGIASIVFGLLWSALMKYAQKEIILLSIFLAVISYWIIKAFTGQSRNNIVVLLATIIAICVGFMIAQALFRINPLP